MNPYSGIRVYVVDDHEVVRRGIASLVDAEDSMEIVGESGSPGDALPEILDLRPDVAVLGNHLSGGCAADLCQRIRAADPRIKVLVLTGRDDPAAISSAVLAGASGYVVNGIDGCSLVSGIRHVAGGHSLIEPAVVRRTIEEMEMQQRSLEMISELVPQQRSVLFLIGRGMTNRQIAERLVLAEQTVADDVADLLAELGLQHRTQAVLLARRLTGLGFSRPLASAS
ncbi:MULTISPECIES: response regulator [Nocardioides]|uniref:Response regulator n=1 Tax=Nocardioides vastitatis TaxID=2568655 RepID=A0ABW0ZRF3_9ACTN|nr:response regulator transcription factor [Nocardioides sp.]THJ07460.1 response regulator transcription factor [Nocardioides sp.]